MGKHNAATAIFTSYQAAVVVATLAIAVSVVYSASRLLLAVVLAVLVLSVCALVRERQHLLEGQRRHGPKHHEHGTRIRRKSWGSPPPFSPAVKQSGGRRASSALTATQLFETQWELPSEVAVELGGIVDLTVETFISSWYSTMSDDPDVPQDVRLMLCHAFGGLVTRVRTRLHLLSFVVDRVLLALQLHLHWYSAMRAAAAARHPELFSESAGGGILTDSQNRVLLEEYGRSRMYHEGLFSTERWKRLVAGKNGAAAQDESGGVLPLHSLMSNPEQLATLEHAYLRSLSSVLIRRLLRDEDHHCAPMRHLCREVLSGMVLHKVVGQLASPDGINGFLAAALQTLSASSSKPAVQTEATAGVSEKTVTMAQDLVIPMSGAEEKKQPAEVSQLKVETQAPEVTEVGTVEGMAPETPRVVVDDAVMIATTPVITEPVVITELDNGSASGAEASAPPSLPSPSAASAPVFPDGPPEPSVAPTGSEEAADTSRSGDRATQRSQCVVNVQAAADRMASLTQAGGEDKPSTEATDAAAEQLVTALASALVHGLKSEPRDWDAFLCVQERPTEQPPQQLEFHTPASHFVPGTSTATATGEANGASSVSGNGGDAHSVPLPQPSSQPASDRPRGDSAMADGSSKPEGGALTSLFSVLERRRNPGEEDFFTGSTRWFSEGVGAMFSTSEPTAADGSGPASANNPPTHTALPPVVEPSAVEEAQGNGTSDPAAITASPSTTQKSPWRAFSPRKTPPLNQHGRRPSLSVSDASRAPAGTAVISAPSPPGVLGRLFRLRRSPSSGPRSLAEALLESLELGSLATCLAAPSKEGLEEAYDKGALMMDADARGSLVEAVRSLQSIRVPISAELKARVRSRRRGASKANEDETTRSTSTAAEQQQESKLDSLMGGLKRGSLSMFGPRRSTDPAPPTPLPPNPSSSPNTRLTTPQANGQTRADVNQATSPRNAKPPASPLPTVNITTPSKAATASPGANGTATAGSTAPSAAGGGGLSLLPSWPQWGSDASTSTPTNEANNATPSTSGSAPSSAPSPSTVVKAPWSPTAAAASPRLSLSLLDLSTSLATSSYVPRSLEPPLSASRRRSDGALVYGGANTGIAETQRDLCREAERATDERFPDPSTSPASLAAASLLPIMRLFTGAVGGSSRRASRDSQQGQSRSPMARAPPDMAATAASERTERGLSGSGGTTAALQAPAAPIQGMSKPVMLRTAYKLQFLLASSRRLPLETLLTQGIWREASHGALSAEVMPQVSIPAPVQPGQSKKLAGPTLFNIRVAPAPPSTPLPQSEDDNPRPSSLPRPWMVRRRYSDFQRFDRHLRSQLSAELGARLPRLPPKRTASHNSHTLSQPAPPPDAQRLGDECREGLNRYLTALHADPRLASSLEVAIFLTANAMPLRSNPNALAQTRPDGYTPANLGESETTFLAPGFLDGLVLETRLFGLLEEVFDLNSLHVVRRQVLAVAKKAARAFFSGSINQKLLTTYASITSVASFVSVCSGMRSFLWPNGVFFTQPPPPTEEDKARLQASVQTGLRELGGSLSNMGLSKLLGQECTEQGLMRVFEALQSPFFTTNLAYSLLDLLLLELFPQDVDVSAVAHGLDSLLPDPDDGIEY